MIEYFIRIKLIKHRFILLKTRKMSTYKNVHLSNIKITISVKKINVTKKY